MDAELHKVYKFAYLYGYQRAGSFAGYVRAMATDCEWAKLKWLPHQKRFSPKQVKMIVEILGSPPDNNSL